MQSRRTGMRCNNQWHVALLVSILLSFALNSLTLTWWACQGGGENIQDTSCLTDPNPLGCKVP
jgi:hypothetical protein